MKKQPIIFTEGKSDWKHIKQAMIKLKFDKELSFYFDDKYSGDDTILKICEAKATTPNDTPNIFIFDRDNPRIIKEVTDPEKEFKDWGNNVFTLVLPIPHHRETTNENISIEFYYSDSDLQITDSDGRRLFLSSEFDEQSGRHRINENISHANRYKLKGATDLSKAKIIDTEVFDANKRSLALTKDKFAEYILKATPPYHDMEFSSFQILFDLIKKIIDTSKNKFETVAHKEAKLIPIKFSSERSLTDYPPVVHFFVGRKNDLNKLESNDFKVIAITGLGGEGKSTLAARYFELATSKKTTRKFESYAWSDFKDMDTPLHDKLLGILEKISDGKESKEKYTDENLNETIFRFVDTLNKKKCLIVFDNVDGFVDKDTCGFIDKLKILFDELTNRLQDSLVIFTCRSAIEDYHITFLEVPLRGLSFSETKELADGFGILGERVNEALLSNIYDATSGHALWLNLIFAQIRSERFTKKSVTDIISSQSKYLDANLLSSIWSLLSNNEKEIIQLISIFTRPPDLLKIHKASRFNFQKCRNIISSLVRLKLVTEVEIDSDTHYDLHPIIRVKARESCLPERKRVLQKCVIAVLSFGAWKKLEDIVNLNDSYTSAIDNYVECAEIAIENKDFNQAIDFIFHVSGPLKKYGEDAKFIQLCKDLFTTLDQEKFPIGVHSNTSEIYRDFIDALLDQGEYILANEYLDKFNRSIKTFAQFVYFSEIQAYNLWFQNKFSEALVFIEGAINRIREKDEIISSHLLYHQALSNRDMGNIDLALNHFLQQTPEEKIKDWNPEKDEDISSDVGNISRCYYLKGENQKSLELCTKCLKYLSKGQSRRHKVNYGYGLLWMSDIYIKMKNFKESAKYINEAIKVWKVFCPARLVKIKTHLKKYPKKFNETYDFSFE